MRVAYTQKSSTHALLTEHNKTDHSLELYSTASSQHTAIRTFAGLQHLTGLISWLLDLNSQSPLQPCRMSCIPQAAYAADTGTLPQTQKLASIITLSLHLHTQCRTPTATTHTATRRYLLFSSCSIW